MYYIFLVHRIGRTGRSGRTGIATTFINKANDESVLLDLKHLLMEAKQKVPPFLLELCSENEKYLNLGGKIIVSNLSIFYLMFISSFVVTIYILTNFNIFLALLQTNAVAVIAAGLDTELQSVRNWRLCRTNRRPISDVAIIWLAMLLIIKQHVLLLNKTVSMYSL